MKNDRSLALAALVFVCLVWGSTYLAVKTGTDQIGPFRLAFIRQFLAVGILLGWYFLTPKNRAKTLPSRAHFLRQIAVGALTVGCWNAMANWAIMSVPTSIVALISALAPAFIAILSHFWTKTEHLRPIQWLGIALGFLGLGLIFRDGWAREMSSAYLLGIFLTLGASVIWAFGTVAAKRFSSASENLILDVVAQLFGGGAVSLVASFFYDFWMPFRLDAAGWWSLFYVVVFGSVLAMTAYLFALKRLPATVASMYTYVNPVIALVLGVLFLGETITPNATVGMAVTLGGVFLVNQKRG